jgi:hypothetical protein
VTTAALRVLLSGLIDYAGLFPPAALSLAEVASNYGEYRRSGNAWMLGRLVVPAARLPELAQLVPEGERWPVSALLSAPDTDLDLIDQANSGRVPALHVDTLEARCATPHDVARLMQRIPGGDTLYVEFPRAHADEFLGALKSSGARAKIRMGGVTEDAFPSAEEVAVFMTACVRAGIPFKATAGLHHPLRGLQRLSYDDDAPTGQMHGFLNVFLASAFARAGMNGSSLVALLLDGDPRHFTFSDGSIGWEGQTLSLAQLEQARECTAIAFGSCSFTEPVQDLVALGLL